MASTRFTIMHIDDFERPWPKWLLARRSLGLNSFGMNVCHLEPGEDIPEHNEAERDHEEVFARVDPSLTRTVRNVGSEPARVLIVSAPRSSGYEPLSWA